MRKIIMTQTIRNSVEERFGWDQIDPSLNPKFYFFDGGYNLCILTLNVTFNGEFTTTEKKVQINLNKEDALNIFEQMNKEFIKTYEADKAKEEKENGSN